MLLKNGTGGNLVKNKLFCFGMGYVASLFSEKLISNGWSVSATCRLQEKSINLKKQGCESYIFSSGNRIPDLTKALQNVTHILVSIPPENFGDPVINHYKKQISSINNLQWVTYLSSTGVYGNHNGEWINEKTKPIPSSIRGERRLVAENQWQDSFGNKSLSLNIFRLSGIYGPDRNSFIRIKEGKAKRIIKKNLFFNRVHIEDIVGFLCASVKMKNYSGVYNLSDDEPAPPQDVITYACKLLGVDPPPTTIYNEENTYDKEYKFYFDSKKVSNERIKKRFKYNLKYKSYREGLKSILQNVTANNF